MNGDLAFTFTVLGYCLYLLVVFVLSVILLHDITVKHTESSTMVLIIAIMMSILTAFTIFVAIGLGARHHRGICDFHRDDGTVNTGPRRFFIVRSVFFSFSVLAAWFVYVRLRASEDFSALRWAFVLENSLIVVLGITIVALLYNANASSIFNGTVRRLLGREVDASPEFTASEQAL